MHSKPENCLSSTHPFNQAGMGIKGLLPCLQSITKNVSLEKYRGLTAAVDAMCWLHKGVFTGDVRALAKYQFQVNQNEPSHQEQAEEVHANEMEGHDDRLAKRINFDAFSSVKKTKNSQIQSVIIGPSADAKMAMTKCADYVIRHAQRVTNEYGVELILVIDGGSLPSKKSINENRRLDRIDAYQKGLQADRRGDNREARKQFSRACSISHEVRRELVIQCQQKGIQFVIAPYEADAQLAQLAHSGSADVVITEDSDLLVYACPRVLFKIDFKTGRGDEIQVMRDLALNSALRFLNWNHDMFVYMCILAGCDYCEGVPGIGIQTAHKLVRIYRSPSKIFRSLRASGKLPVGFEEAFWVAYRTFRHQRIYCPDKRVIEALFPIQEKGDHNIMWDFAGPWLDPSIGQGIAEGRLHPSNHLPWKEICAGKAQRQVTNNSVARLTSKPRKSRNDETFSSAKDPSASKDDIFAFFKPKGGKNVSNNKMKSKRLPLREIQVNQLHDTLHTSHGQPVPSNFHDYSSKFVATSFQTLSRNSKSSRLLQKRKGVSKAIHKLKNRLSLKKVLEKENGKRLERAAACIIQKPAMKTARHSEDDDSTYSTKSKSHFDRSVVEISGEDLRSMRASQKKDSSSYVGSTSKPLFDYDPPPQEEVNGKILVNFNEQRVFSLSTRGQDMYYPAQENVRDDANKNYDDGQSYFQSVQPKFSSFGEIESTDGSSNVYRMSSSEITFEPMSFEHNTMLETTMPRARANRHDCYFDDILANPFDEVTERFEYGPFSRKTRYLQCGDSETDNNSDLPQCQEDDWKTESQARSCFEDVDIFQHL